MRKIIRPDWLVAFLILSICFAFTTAEHGVYVQLHPGNKNKIVIQILPDKTYTDVVAYINFYSADNKRVAQKPYTLSDEKDRSIRKGKCTTRVFKFSFDKTVTRVTVDRVHQGEVLDKNSKGTKLTLPVVNHALGPVE